MCKYYIIFICIYAYIWYRYKKKWIYACLGSPVFFIAWYWRSWTDLFPECAPDAFLCVWSLLLKISRISKLKWYWEGHLVLQNNLIIIRINFQVARQWVSTPEWMNSGSRSRLNCWERRRIISWTASIKFKS